MGREKRKGKEIVVEEPARKRTRAAREAARERAATEERFVRLIDRVSQRTDTQFQQMQ
jgi:hypothetical protein